MPQGVREYSMEVVKLKRPGSVVAQSVLIEEQPEAPLQYSALTVDEEAALKMPQMVAATTEAEKWEMAEMVAGEVTSTLSEKLGLHEEFVATVETGKGVVVEVALAYWKLALLWQELVVVKRKEKQEQFLVELRKLEEDKV